MIENPLSREDLSIIEEETKILSEVQSALLVREIPKSQKDLYQEIIDLRDSISETRLEDLPAILAEMDRLALLSQQQTGKFNGAKIDRNKPYFGHIRLEEEHRKRDILIGNLNFTSDALIYPIIDWKHAPISQIYYRYREGEEFFEEIEDRDFEGTLLVRRTVSIIEGKLYKISLDGYSLVLGEDGWQRHQARTSLVNTQSSGLRVTPSSDDRTSKSYVNRKDKHLQEITALIDPDQFEIITKPESGVVVIQGGAGSGKTTIALHRLAYLVSGKPRYFVPQNVITVVFNKALSNYISKVLPSLGVKGVQSWIFQEWTNFYMRRYFPNLPKRHSTRTPVSVIELKRHPGVLNWLIKEMKQVEVKFIETLYADLPRELEKKQVQRVWETIKDWPLANRILTLARWSQDRMSIDRVPPCNNYVIKTRILDIVGKQFSDLENNLNSIAITIWEECFIQLEKLKENVDSYMPGVFTESQIKEVWEWSVKAYEARSQTPIQLDDEGIEIEETKAEIDEEDETILLLLYQMTLGPFLKKKRKRVVHPHIMVDEAQDFSPIEFKLLFNTAPSSRKSITLAGDYDQQITVGSSVENWSEMLSYLNVDSTAISPLKVGYRSTEQIMEVARAIIGSKSVNQEWKAVRSGAPVELFKMNSQGEMIQFVAESLTDLVVHEPAASIVVLTRYASQADVVFEGLKNADVPKINRIKEQDFSFAPGIEVTNIAQVKGLEFDYVILIDADKQIFPDEDSARHLLYVAVTRAAHQLWIFTRNDPSPLLPLEVIKDGF